MNLYDQARKYVFTNKWSVIPVKTDGSKQPNLPSWKEYQSRFPTDEELVSWFKGTSNGIGIVTGKISNLSIIDDDSGKRTFDTPGKVITPRPGRHFYFQYTENLKGSVNTNEKLDIRSQGNFVVAPPTPNYRWINPYFRISHLPSFPLNLLPMSSTVLQKAPLDIVNALTNLKPGNRDATFTSLIGKLHRDRYSAEAIMLFLGKYAEETGFGRESLAKKIQHILSDYPHQDDQAGDDVSSFLQDITPVEWIAPGIIARGSIGFIAGLPETFKTWLTLDLAIECARGGGKWLGKFNVRKAKVLFVDQERYKAETQRRFKALLSAKGVTAKSLSDSLFIRCGSTTRLDLDESYKAFRAHLERISPDLVIVDSFATFHTKEENDRREIQMVLERLKQLRQEFGCTFMFIDHEGKSVFTDQAQKEAPSAFRMVGSVGKTAAAEFVFTVRKTNAETCMVYNTKNTLAPCIESFSVTVKDTPEGITVSTND